MLNAPIRNILIIKPGTIGDLLQLTPVFRALHRAIPEARITVMVGSAGTASILDRNPYVGGTMVFDRKGRHRPWRAFRELCRNVRDNRFDLVLNFQRSNLKAWLLVAAALPCRVLVYHKARGRKVHAVINHLETLKPLGVDPLLSDNRLELYPGEEAERWADEMLQSAGLEGRTLVALNLGASHPVNRWPTRLFASLAQRLHPQAGVAVVLVGGGEDTELASEVRKAAGVPLLDLVGKTSLLQLGAVLKRCAVTVSGDTGPMHISTAVGTPVVALFGAADLERTGPVGEGHRIVRAVGVSCVPCRSRTCKNPEYLQCMEQITVEEVLQQIFSILGEKP